MANSKEQRSVLRIGQLRIRVPGMDRAEAERLGRQVAEHLSQGMDAGGMHHTGKIGSMDVRMRAGNSGDHLARKIAENIMRRIG
jgi:hypothetical protein